MKPPVFTGTCTALITPFHLSGEVDYDTFRRQIDRQVEAGIDALCVCGTTGESATLTAQEHSRLVEVCVSQVGGRCKVIAGAGSNDTAAALFLCQHAEDAGADGLLVVTPYYNKTTQSGLVHHYETLAEGTSLPIILYNVPSRTGLSFTPQTYHILSQHPRINGIKEASGDFSLLADTLALCGDHLHIWSGNDDQTVPILSMGGKGLISVLSNLMPREMTELTHRFLSGDLTGARELQVRTAPLTRALFSQVNPIPIKAAMREAGLDSGVLRSPLVSMDPAPLSALREAMKQQNLLS
ncbi:MAG: 4-hydroxy-tetrahydrodipicolinate synthase [Evtepia sp.]|uniref:4-hydroxy-tetrahydrodipicolinate synthase n=1 Tax=Evtepia sp. TaxID=2773933 RepID=UPI002A74BDAC|nr:4-hydroxy-tetrahydrodipicolinate synthase [Evtepia sp.]MDY3013628.1 4-hydroxy-tetrahydrodipicolinate synthase [Evtepia sp.]